MKKVFALFIVICFAFVLGACHYQYYNDGSDYAAPGFKQGETLAVSYVPKTLDDLSDFERNFITEIFGENYGFAGYDAMTQADKAKIVAYFKEYNEGYYSVGFDNGFFYTFNELKAKKRIQFLGDMNLFPIRYRNLTSAPKQSPLFRKLSVS